MCRQTQQLEWKSGQTVAHKKAREPGSMRLTNMFAPKLERNHVLARLTEDHLRARRSPAGRQEALIVIHRFIHACMHAASFDSRG